MKIHHVVVFCLFGLATKPWALAFVHSPKRAIQLPKTKDCISTYPPNFLSHVPTISPNAINAKIVNNATSNTKLRMSTKAADAKALGKMRLATAMAFLAGWANIAIYLRFKTFATMLTGNTMWMAMALTERKYSTVAYYVSVITSYLVGTALFRRIDLSLRKKTLPVCSAIVASLFVAGDCIHHASSGLMPMISKWIPMMMFATGYGVINSLGMEVTGTLNFVITGHYSKLVNNLVDRISRTAGRKKLTEAEKKIAAQNAAISGGFFGGALFASFLLRWKCLHRFGMFSAIGLSHAVLWLARDIEALGGAWWLRKEGEMCDLDDDGGICDLPDDDQDTGNLEANVNGSTPTNMTLNFIYKGRYSKDSDSRTVGTKILPSSERNIITRNAEASSGGKESAMFAALPPPERLRRLLDDEMEGKSKSDKPILLPCCYDGLTARLVARAGFEATFMTGFGVSGVRGYPDTQLVSYREMMDSANIVSEGLTGAALELGKAPIPCIADGDTGYGNAVNCKRTVQGYARAGMAGIMIEDQVAPKRCGHVAGKSVIPFDEAVQRVKAACDARDEYETMNGKGTGPLILARTDSLVTDGFEDAIQRCLAFRKAGCDMTFLEAPQSIEQMKEYCDRVSGPKLANMLEYGSTPVLPPKELKQMGYTMAAYPLTLLSASIKAMQDSLELIKNGEPTDDMILTFGETKDAVGFTRYADEEDLYKTS